MTNSKIGDKILVGVVPVKGQKMLSPDVNSREFYLPDDGESFAGKCVIGEIWIARVLTVDPMEETRGGPFGLVHRVTVKLLERDEHAEKGYLDRSAKEWVVERKSGVRVLETVRTPVRVLQKKVVEGNYQITVERIENNATGKIISEYEYHSIHLDEIRRKEREKLKDIALSRQNIHGK